MIGSIHRRVRLVFGRPSPVPAEPTDDTTPVPGPDLDFVAYGEDCLLSGRLRLDGDRLSDVLNDHDEFQLIDVFVEGVADDQPTGIELKTVVVTRDELYLVHATGPRGNPGRRQRTRQHPIAMQLGPYHVRGYLHALPGTDPIASLRRRKPIFALTEAWVEYSLGGTLQRRHVSSLLVNRHQIDWVVEVEDDEVEFPELPVRSQGPLDKDFTGQLLVDPG